MLERFVIACIVTIFLGIMSRIMIGAAMKKRKMALQRREVDDF